MKPVLGGPMASTRASWMRCPRTKDTTWPVGQASACSGLQPVDRDLKNESSMRPMTVHRIRAVNTATDSENKIHDDQVAARYGFQGGLVPGVTVYGYMTLPVIEHFGDAWPEHGAMSVRFKAPVYDGEEVVI